jgi:hypothetical protein
VLSSAQFSGDSGVNERRLATLRGADEGRQVVALEHSAESPHLVASAMKELVLLLSERA